METHWMEGFAIGPMFLSCTGKFDGGDKARAGHFPHTGENIFYGVAGENLRGGSFPSQPRIRPVIGGKFTMDVYPLERKVYRTLKKAETIGKRICSKEKTKTQHQALAATGQPGFRPGRRAPATGARLPGTPPRETWQCIRIRPVRILQIGTATDDGQTDPSIPIRKTQSSMRLGAGPACSILTTPHPGPEMIHRALPLKGVLLCEQALFLE
ncbi:hypothetical protein ACFQ36_13105 [Arthrobacter sp. GCM10027362]